MNNIFFSLFVKIGKPWWMTMCLQTGQSCTLKKKSVHDCLKHQSCARFDQLNKYLSRHNIYLVGQTGQEDAKPGKLYFTTTGCKAVVLFFINQESF